MITSFQFLLFHTFRPTVWTMSPNRPNCCLRTVLACHPIICRPKNNSPKRLSPNWFFAQPSELPSMQPYNYGRWWLQSEPSCRWPLPQDNAAGRRTITAGRYIGPVWHCNLDAPDHPDHEICRSTFDPFVIALRIILIMIQMLAVSSASVWSRTRWFKMATSARFVFNVKWTLFFLNLYALDAAK